MFDGKPQLGSLSFGMENSDQYKGLVATSRFSIMNLRIECSQMNSMKK
jgi:hypothetical protein